VDVEVGPVLDLTDGRVLRAAGIDADVLTGDRPWELAACRAIAAHFVLGEGYGAILAPSAARPGESNLMIYLRSTLGIRLLGNGPDRLTITPGENAG
jgi:RES domain-containing protein